MSESSWDWLTKLRGRILVFDGPDGGGKTTQVDRFTDYLQRHRLEVCTVREPGGTQIGEQIRCLLLDPENREMDMRCEMLLYMASRAQLVASTIRPALRQGKIVLADRFVSATMAYQGAGGHISREEIRKVGQIALGDCWPDLVVILDVDQMTTNLRLNPNLDRIERRSAEYHQMVRAEFLEQARRDPRRYAVVNASGDADSVFVRIVDAVRSQLNEGS